MSFKHRILHAIARRCPHVCVADVFVGDLSAHDVPPFDYGPHVRARIVRHETDEGFEDLAEIIAGLGGSRQHLAREFQSGGLHSTIVYLRESHSAPWRAAAMSCLLRGEKEIPQLGSIFRPSPAEGYFFGDYVLPKFRRRGLQRVLIHHRAVEAMKDGTRWLYGFIARGNTPSRRAAARVGSEKVATVHKISVARWAIVHVRRRDDRELPFEGWNERGRAFFLLTCDGVPVTGKAAKRQSRLREFSIRLARPDDPEGAAA